MGKILITKNNLSQFLDKSSCVLKLGKNMIISPGAKDEIRQLNYKIQYVSDEIVKVEKMQDNSNEEELIKERIRKILKSNYDVDNEDIVEKIIQEVRKIGGNV